MPLPAPPGRPSASAGFLPAAGRIAAGALSACLAACADGERPRNAILVSLDTLRPDHLSCYGHPRETSPRLSALAAEGVRFADVTAAAPWTLPSHASLLTGLYPSHHGVKDHDTCLAETHVTLAEELAAEGFQTMAVVNTHNLGAPQYRLQQGFEPARFEYVVETAEGAGGDDPQATQGPRVPNGGRLVVERARALLAGRDPSRPFFLFLHFYDTHTDYTPDEQYRRELVGPYAGTLGGETRALNALRNRGELPGPEDLRHLRELYDAEIRTLDAVLGEFLDWLRAERLLEETLIVITSDHGEEFGEHGGLLHGRTQYQELLRVPLIVAGPGVPSGQVVETPVHGVDVTPTLLAALGVSSSQTRDGLDLAPLWRGESLPARFLFAEADQDNSAPGQNDRKAMVRNGALKLVFDRTRASPELYDLERDPGERRDLAAERADLARELARALRDHAASAVEPQRIAGPSEEERALLDALGYGGGDDGDEEADEN